MCWGSEGTVGQAVSGIHGARCRDGVRWAGMMEIKNLGGFFVGPSTNFKIPNSMP